MGIVVSMATEMAARSGSALVEPAGPQVTALLDAAEPVADAHALVVGHDTLETLCGLIARGCGAALELPLEHSTGARPLHERAELVLVPHLDDLNEASAAIALARRSLLPCGRIVLQDQTGRLSAPIAQMLRAAGFSAVRTRAARDNTIVTADWPMFGLHTTTGMPRHT